MKGSVVGLPEKVFTSFDIGRLSVSGVLAEKLFSA